jgi:hypothetical protein
MDYAEILIFLTGAGAVREPPLRLRNVPIIN